MQPPTKEVTIDDARAALELHVQTTRWLRRGLAARLPIESFTRSGSFHIVFRSFTEARAAGPAHVPYRGGPVDGPDRGRPPAPWDMPVRVPGTFINQDHYEPVPHTDEVRTCHVCNGDGRITCSQCAGSGRIRCSRCGGDGRVTGTRTGTRTGSNGQTETYTETYTETCNTCNGDGRVVCPPCGGSGRVTCPACEGATRLKHYLRLHVSWKTKVGDHIIEKTDLPDWMVAGAEGIVIHAEEEDRLEPVEHAAGGGGGPYRGGGARVNAEVNEAANRLIHSHRFPNGTKLHRQSLHVRAVPIYEARYRWGKDIRQFWVYGTDQQVYAPNFPLSIVRVGLAIGIPVTLLGAVVIFFAVNYRPGYQPREPLRAPPPAVTTPR